MPLKPARPEYVWPFLQLIGAKSRMSQAILIRPI